MSSGSATATAAPAIRGSGAIAIVATLAIAGLWGARQLWDDLSLPLGVVSNVWVLISLVVWAVYGLCLLLLVRRPARKAHVLPLGIALALLWGGFTVSHIAGIANGAVQTMAINSSDSGDGAWTTWAIAPGIEETIKTLGIVLLALLPAARRFGAGAGLVIGALVGVSFQVVENFVYTLQGMFDAPDQYGAVLVQMLYVRGVVGIFSHVVFSAVIGAAVGWFISTRGEPVGRRIGLVIGAFLAMVGLHMSSNWASLSHQSLMYIALMVVGLVVLLAAARWAKAVDARASQDPSSATGRRPTVN